MSETSAKKASAPLVAIVAWLLPGAGHLLLGQTARALTIGITIIVLFVAGVLIGGVRVIEVPGFGDHGKKLVVSEPEQGLEHIAESTPTDDHSIGWVMQVHPLDEIRNKPWYVAQILAGPINLAASWGSVIASRVGPNGDPLGFRSHSRTNELGVLYTAVAGMLNLLAIIDATSRAGAAEELA